LNKLDDILFELLQVAIGNRLSLSRVLSPKEWNKLRIKCKKHALLGVGYCGIVRLSKEQYPPVEKLVQWVFDAENIRKKNGRLKNECVELCKQLEHDGFDCCILKGQSNLENYTEDLREYRTCGDIDVLMRSKEKPEAIDLPIQYCIKQCNLHDEPVGKICYHHMDMPFVPSGWTSKDEQLTPVEIHYRACWLSSPLRNRRLQRWLEDNMPFAEARCCSSGRCPSLNVGEDVTNRPSDVAMQVSFPMPSNSYNAVFQLIHIFKHLFEEGVGLRQLLDYYFVLRALHFEQEEKSNESIITQEDVLSSSVLSNAAIMYNLKRFGLAKFAGAVMWVLKEVFNMPDIYMICEPNAEEGKWLLNEVMQAGNFGRYDKRNEGRGHVNTKLSRALMLIRHYPHEALWQPWFMLYHWMFRRFEWWKQ